MKRTLLGFAVLAVVVGVGSAGVFYANQLYTSGTPASDTTADAPAALPRDLTPTPIPLSDAPRRDDRADGDPFSRSSQPQRVETTDDRYADSQAPEQSAEPADSEVHNARDLPGRGDEMPATRSADPFAARGRSTSVGRYPEKPTSAEVPEAEPADEAQGVSAPSLSEDEPRQLAAPATLGRVDRYGRPIAADENQPARQTPPADDIPPNAGATPPPRQAITDPPADKPTPDEAPPVSEGTGRPGDPQLSGSQAPTLTIEKLAPPEIQIGKAARFLIKVRNAGTVVAQGVEIHDTIPQGTQLIDAVPTAKRGADGELLWDLGTLKPGDEQTAELRLMPTAEGEIGSVATVHFHAQASVRTLATKPMLNLEVSSPTTVMKGAEVTYRIRLSNPGSGAASGVVLSEQVPPGLSHPTGKELELDIGTLKPGESRELQLQLVAAAAGPVTNLFVAQAEGNLKAEAKSELEVVAPQLQVGMSGPKRRYLERNATHQISVTNPGTAPAKDIELVAVLPRELKFVSANNGGQFDAATQSVYWSLEELPPQETGTVTLTTLPLQPGEARLVIKSKAQAGLAAQREEIVLIDGLAAINFQLSDVTGPVEVNGQTTYQVRVSNPGSKTASNVRLAALLPREMKAVSADGPVRYRIEGQRVVFEPLKQLAAKGEATFNIKAQALAAGDVRVQVQVASDDIREPITKEENTRVFGNE